MHAARGGTRTEHCGGCYKLLPCSAPAATGRAGAETGRKTRSANAPHKHAAPSQHKHKTRSTQQATRDDKHARGQRHRRRPTPPAAPSRATQHTPTRPRPGPRQQPARHAATRQTERAGTAQQDRRRRQPGECTPSNADRNTKG